MSREELYEIANQGTPESVYVPKNSAAFIVWALSKWGVGAFGLILLAPVYMDLRESNANLVKLTSANVEAIVSFAAQVKAVGVKVEDLGSKLDKIEVRYHSTLRQ